MTPSRFWKEHAQGDLFPNRTTVGFEFAAELIIKPALPNASGRSTDGGPRVDGAVRSSWQARLPLVGK